MDLLVFMGIGMVMLFLIAGLFYHSRITAQRTEAENREANRAAQYEWQLTALNNDIEQLRLQNAQKDARLEELFHENQAFRQNLATANANLQAREEELQQSRSNAKAWEEKWSFTQNQKQVIQEQLAHDEAKLAAQEDKLNLQKKEMESMQVQFRRDFENLANKILEEKTEKFSKYNQEQMTNILKPLDESLQTFRKKVEEVYDKESKERFSLGQEVQKLKELNLKMSEDAINLTKALKGDAKIQGDWGQMILERILERSGLAKGREYEVQNFLRDEHGHTLKNEAGRKMQPDVIMFYPDNRKVVIDAKVSLTAYTRYMEADDEAIQKLSLKEHLVSIRRHIDELSVKDYQDYADSLDFVMLFIPTEPAYLLAMREEENLWEYAYNKRVLLISPTNLIAALKLIADLWKREYQNRNTLEIAKRGAALYDKFVNFTESMVDIGRHLDKSQRSYLAAMSQLKEGKGNLISQAEKLRHLGVKTKKQLPPGMEEE
jgi:DNA recombination protein RmuC